MSPLLAASTQIRWILSSLLDSDVADSPSTLPGQEFPGRVISTGVSALGLLAHPFWTWPIDYQETVKPGSGGARL